MAANENKAVVRRLVEEVFNQKKTEVANELFDFNYVNNTPPPEEGTKAPPPGQIRGVEPTKNLFDDLQQAFPDSHGTIEDMIAEGDKVVTLVRWHATHRGPFYGIKPTGKDATFRSIHICRLANGKIVEHWGEVDNLEVLRQLGVDVGQQQAQGQ